ncbi:MAG: glycoside hydrolase domain-containing protein, partial [Candidatus Zipacnadales bacterium]
LRQLHMAVSDLTSEAGTISASAITWNPVGYIPLTRNTPNTPQKELCCKAPCEVPDPLLPSAPIDVAANETQPLWLTVHVPRNATPAEYAGQLTVRWEGGETTLSLALTVWPFALPEEHHLSYTNWISAEALAKHHGVEAFTEPFWELLGKYAQAASAHHQNILWVSLGLVGITRRADGEFEFDWRRFDRWVEVVTANGCGRLIEIQPLGGWANGNWASPQIAFHDYSIKTADGTPMNVSAEECLPRLLPALQAHLEEHGWLERTVIHIADEPAVHHTESWREKARWVHSLAPGLRRIDAIEAPNFGNDLEIWVPKLNHLYNWLPHYERAREIGHEVWFYTCCHPTGVFPNRFLDQPLLKTRILQWYNWRYALSGYLHWGLNWWDDQPLRSAGPTNLPPGDCWIIYPGREGPLSSLRWEALRDGFEDYEYLWLLADRNRQVAESLGVPLDSFRPEQRSDELAYKLVRTMIDYARDPHELWSVREEIAAEIIQLEAAPRALLVTDPPTYHVLAIGPIVVATRIWAEQGATVTVNGQPAHRQPDGSWAHHTFVEANTAEVRAEITTAEAQKVIKRRFEVFTGQEAD